MHELAIKKRTAKITLLKEKYLYFLVEIQNPSMESLSEQNKDLQDVLIPVN